MAEDPDHLKEGPCAHCAYTGYITQLYRHTKTFDLCFACYSTIRAGEIVAARLDQLEVGEQGVTGLFD